MKFKRFVLISLFVSLLVYSIGFEFYKPEYFFEEVGNFELNSFSSVIKVVYYNFVEGLKIILDIARLVSTLAVEKFPRKRVPFLPSSCFDGFIWVVVFNYNLLSVHIFLSFFIMFFSFRIFKDDFLNFKSLIKLKKAPSRSLLLCEKFCYYCPRISIPMSIIWESVLSPFIDFLSNGFKTFSKVSFPCYSFYYFNFKKKSLLREYLSIFLKKKGGE